MFKILKSVLPLYVNKMFPYRPFNETLQSLRSTGALEFYTSMPQKQILKQSLIYSGPVIWNNLPDRLKTWQTVNTSIKCGIMHCILSGCTLFAKTIKHNKGKKYNNIVFINCENLIYIQRLIDKFAVFSPQKFIT